MPLSLNLEDTDENPWTVVRFEADNDLANELLEKAQDLCEEANIPFKHGSIPDSALGAEERATEMQIANFMMQRYQEGGPSSVKDPLLQDVKPVSALKDRLGREEEEEEEEKDERQELSPIEAAKQAYREFDRGERESPDLQNYDLTVEQRKKVLQDRAEAEEGGGEKKDLVSENDGPMDVEEALNLYKNKPRKINLEKLERELTPEQFKEFDRRKREVSSNSSSMVPDSVEPDRQPEEPLEADEISVKDYGWADAPGVGDTTEQDIKAHLDERGLNTMQDVLSRPDLDFAEVPGVGEKTSEGIVEALEDDFPEDNPLLDAPDGKDEGSGARDGEKKTEEPAQDKSGEPEDDQEKDEGDDKELEQEAPESSSEPSGSTTLIIGASPVKSGDETIVLEDAIEPLKRKIEEERGVAHYSMVDYNEWKDDLAKLVRENFESLQGSTLVISTPALDAMDPVMDALIPLCDRVYKA